jgi:hypothetical protein
LLRIDDSDTRSQRLACGVVATSRVHLLVLLSPPLLAELATRRLAPSRLAVVVVAAGAPVPPGHYDVVVRNIALPEGVTADLVVDLPAPAGAALAPSTAGEVVALDRLEDLAGLLAARWPSAS